MKTRTTVKRKQTRAEKLDRRLRDVINLYEKHGTTVAVAEAIGVSRQRAAQLLERGSAEGLVTYDPVRRMLTKAEAKKALRETGNITAAAIRCGVTENTFRARFSDLIESHKAQKQREKTRRAEMRSKSAATSAAARQRAIAEGKCSECRRRAARSGLLTCAPCSKAAGEPVTRCEECLAAAAARSRARRLATKR